MLEHFEIYLEKVLISLGFCGISRICASKLSIKEGARAILLISLTFITIAELTANRVTN
jgi:hypothetical protein